MFWTTCAAGAFLESCVEMMLRTGTSRQKHDPTLNASQQPLRREARKRWSCFFDQFAV